MNSAILHTPEEVEAPYIEGEGHMKDNIIRIGGFAIAFLLGLLLFSDDIPEKQQPQQHIIQQPIFPPSPQIPPARKPKPRLVIEEPQWTNYPPIRQVDRNLGKVLGDIESHMPAGHIYRASDKITWAHETSHGLCSNIRNGVHTTLYGDNATEMLNLLIDGKTVYHSGKGGYNGFYVLENRAVVIKEPNTTVSAAARLVPRSLQGMSYNLYMIQQARSWNNMPLYIFDEWVAYSNGSATRIDLKIKDRAETVQQMLEFDGYAMALAMACKSEDPQFKKFLKWHLARSIKLYKANKQIGDLSRSDAYLNTLRNSGDADSLRRFISGYLGSNFTRKTFGF